MKKTPLIILAGLLVMIAAAAVMIIRYEHKPAKHLFILSGQSNMARIFLHESFTPTLTQQFGASNIIIIRNKNRDGLYGKSIQHWYKNWKSAAGEKATTPSDMYDELMKRVYPAIRFQKIKSVTFIWMQGERDAKEKHGDVYAASLEGLIAQLEHDLDRKDINVVIGRIGDFDMTNSTYPHWTLVREAQMKVAEANPHRVWIDTDDLNDGKNRDGNEMTNDLHYSAEGYKILGQRFADAAIALIQKQ